MSNTYLEKYKKSSFAPAFFLLPPERKKALCAVYSFCRIADDIADDVSLSAEEKEKELSDLRKSLSLCFKGNPENELFVDILEASRKFSIKEELFSKIIDGVSMDIRPFSYQTFEELSVYMDAVAVAPGDITLLICGYSADNTALSKKLGYAVQLTNIIRDIYSDAAMGRCYIPFDELKKFSITFEDIVNGIKDERMLSLLDYQAKRAMNFYKEASEIMDMSKQKGLLMSRIIKNLYLSLLLKIKAKNFNIVDKTPGLNIAEKINAVLKAFF